VVALGENVGALDIEIVEIVECLLVGEQPALRGVEAVDAQAAAGVWKQDAAVAAAGARS